MSGSRKTVKAGRPGRTTWTPKNLEFAILYGAGASTIAKMGKDNYHWRNSMKIERKTDRQENTLSYLMLEANGWDRTFEFEGHLYVVIAKGSSQHTNLSSTNGFIPVFNLKSRTVRALPDHTIVVPRNCTVQVDRFYDV